MGQATEHQVLFFTEAAWALLAGDALDILQTLEMEQIRAKQQCPMPQAKEIEVGVAVQATTPEEEAAPGGPVGMQTTALMVEGAELIQFWAFLTIGLAVVQERGIAFVAVAAASEVAVLEHLGKAMEEVI